ncbi:heme-binding domain-containing protein [Chryseobacterium herbae]|uniref:Heme-binding domain-containing protein n=1 Tax=Chryseobacterium herbae TaxID=2976476 RepID=A0ABT2IVC2_9FLAO|nr:heme-binding domain-containing protein [Chryseobacterium sp. pc1-10]MCT2562727.1 heme-binding domain-containing protein [Chryseobacterium sp. pc1-10]
MKKALKITGVILLLVFIAVQLYQPAPNVDKGPAATTDFMQTYPDMPAEMKTIMQTSCYDCHSNNTNYEWYDYIQPARSLLVEKHIKEAKEDLNFSEWNSYSERKQKRLITSIKKQIETKKMPLPSYTLMHNNAKLTHAQIKILTQWLETQE